MVKRFQKGGLLKNRETVYTPILGGGAGSSAAMLDYYSTDDMIKEPTTAALAKTSSAQTAAQKKYSLDSEKMLTSDYNYLYSKLAQVKTELSGLIASGADSTEKAKELHNIKLEIAKAKEEKSAFDAYKKKVEGNNTGEQLAVNGNFAYVHDRDNISAGLQYISIDKLLTQKGKDGKSMKYIPITISEMLNFRKERYSFAQEDMQYIKEIAENTMSDDDLKKAMTTIKENSNVHGKKGTSSAVIDGVTHDLNRISTGRDMKGTMQIRDIILGTTNGKTIQNHARGQAVYKTYAKQAQLAGSKDGKLMSIREIQNANMKVTSELLSSGFINAIASADKMDLSSISGLQGPDSSVKLNPVATAAVMAGNSNSTVKYTVIGDNGISSEKTASGAEIQTDQLISNSKIADRDNKGKLIYDTKITTNIALRKYITPSNGRLADGTKLIDNEKDRDLDSVAPDRTVPSAIMYQYASVDKNGNKVFHPNFKEKLANITAKQRLYKEKYNMDWSKEQLKTAFENEGINGEVRIVPVLRMNVIMKPSDKYNAANGKAVDIDSERYQELDDTVKGDGWIYNDKVVSAPVFFELNSTALTTDSEVKSKGDMDYMAGIDQSGAVDIERMISDLDVELVNNKISQLKANNKPIKKYAGGRISIEKDVPLEEGELKVIIDRLF